MILSLPQRAQCTTTIVHLYPLGMIFAGAVPTMERSPKVLPINRSASGFLGSLAFGALGCGGSASVHPL